MKINAIQFILSGEAACFRKPDVNVKVYFTYNNIHKVALLGILGAILGLKGYRNQALFGEKTSDYPEFYERLSGIQVAIRPNADRGYFAKKTQYFNNSVGYASQEEGGNLQVYEQWLEKPSWTIYLGQGTVESSLWERLCDSLLKQRCVYIPYLGKNDFPAVITSVTRCEMTLLKKADSFFIDSLFVGELDDVDDIETVGNSLPYIFSEYAPVRLKEKYNFYELRRLIYTNCAVRSTEGELFQVDDKIICFL